MKFIVILLFILTSNLYASDRFCLFNDTREDLSWSVRDKTNLDFYGSVKQSKDSAWRCISLPVSNHPMMMRVNFTQNKFSKDACYLEISGNVWARVTTSGDDLICDGTAVNGVILKSTSAPITEQQEVTVAVNAYFDGRLSAGTARLIDLDGNEFARGEFDGTSIIHLPLRKAPTENAILEISDARVGNNLVSGLIKAYIPEGFDFESEPIYVNFLTTFVAELISNEGYTYQEANDLVKKSVGLGPTTDLGRNISILSQRSLFSASKNNIQGMIQDFTPELQKGEALESLLPASPRSLKISSNLKTNPTGSTAMKLGSSVWDNKATILSALQTVLRATGHKKLVAQFNQMDAIELQLEEILKALSRVERAIQELDYTNRMMKINSDIAKVNAIYIDIVGTRKDMLDLVDKETGSILPGKEDIYQENFNMVKLRIQDARDTIPILQVLRNELKPLDAHITSLLERYADFQIMHYEVITPAHYAQLNAHIEKFREVMAKVSFLAILFYEHVPTRLVEIKKDYDDNINDFWPTVEKSQSIIPQLFDRTTLLGASFINGSFVYHRRTELLWLLDVPNEKRRSQMVANKQLKLREWGIAGLSDIRALDTGLNYIGKEAKNRFIDENVKFKLNDDTNVYYLSIRNKSDGGNLDAGYYCYFYFDPDGKIKPVTKEQIGEHTFDCPTSASKFWNLVDNQKNKSFRWFPIIRLYPGVRYKMTDNYNLVRE